MKIFNYLIIALLELIRPFFGPARCRFIPSCGNFAIEELKKKSLFQALWSIFKRVFSCNPLYRS